MGSPSVNEEDFARAMRRSLKDHWRLFTVQGVLLVILGMVAVAAPQVAALFASAFIGWILLFSGVFRAVSLIRATRAPGYWSSLLLSFLAAILGFILAWFPLEGAVTLTMLLTAYFIAHGFSSLILAFTIRGETGRWVLLLLSALVDFLLAGTRYRAMALDRALGSRAVCRHQHAADRLCLHFRGARRAVRLSSCDASGVRDVLF